MRDVLVRMARAARPPMHTLSPQAARAAYEAGAGILEIPSPPLARVEDFSIGARDGYALPMRLYAPSHEALPVLLYFHGGGFTIGSIASHDILCRQLSHLAGCAVISVDYRLAPEHKFPTAANDAWDALAWLSFHADDKGLDGNRLAVGGDSAGGTLAAACAIQARDMALPLELQLLIYPGSAAQRVQRRTGGMPKALCWRPRTLTSSSASTCAALPTARTGVLRRSTRPMSRAWPPPGSGWPIATRWLMRAWRMPINCVWPGSRSTRRFTAA